MRTAYHVLAYLIALEVVIQAAVISFAVFGLSKWITGGGVLDKATLESHSAEFTGVIGFAIHGFNGQNIVPILGILLLLVSFFAKVPRGIMWAGLVLLLSSPRYSWESSATAFQSSVCCTVSTLWCCFRSR
jgi:hypothetical protein